MKRLFRIALAAWCALTWCAPMPAESRSDAEAGPKESGQAGGRSNAADAPFGEDVTRLWQEVDAFVRQGAYREALQRLARIQAATPEDPQAALYQSLCHRRLDSPPLFSQLTTEQLAALTARLHEEEQAQRRAGAQTRALERQVRIEQERWDKETAVLQREAEDAQAQQRKAEQAAARRRRRAERASRKAPPAPSPARVTRQARAPSRPLAPPERKRSAPEPPSPEEALQPTPPPSGERAELPEAAPSLLPQGAPAPLVKGGPQEPSVELAPVVVPAAPPDAAALIVARVPPPPGAVQISARQMSVSPDRKIAFAEGDVEVTFENATLICDQLTLFTDTKDVYAEGRVRLEDGTQVSRGEMVQYNFETKKGRFLQGTVSSPPWHEHGRSVEHIAEGVYQVTPGYLTSCELEPPHFKFYGRRATLFAEDKLARVRNAALFVEQVPFLYLPWVSFADRRSPFFVIPGKKKPWEQFVLMGYRYELPFDGSHRGTVHVDWRRAFGWATGVDHQFDSASLGKGLFRLYYNEEPNNREPKLAHPKGAKGNRYRVLWRHRWTPQPDTTVITDIQKYSDVNFRQELLFRDERTDAASPESFISVVKSTPDFTISGQVRRRMNRFQTVTEAWPELSVDAREARIGDTQLFSQSRIGFANFNTKTAHSTIDTDVVRLDWFQQFRYALGLFRPVEVTPRAAVRQTFYTKDIQGGPERPDGRRNLFSGQFSMGSTASLKLFRVFPVATNLFGLDIHALRHVLTPTLDYTYVHQPTVPSSLLNFAAAGGTENKISLGLENTWQTRRGSTGGGKSAASVDLARFQISAPYTFRGVGNKQGGRFGDWSFDLELFPWQWLRVESDWLIPSHFAHRNRDARIPRWNLDVAMVGGQKSPDAKQAPKLQVPESKAFEAGPRGGLVSLLMPQGEWYLGYGHRYSQNDKTEDIIQYDWRLSEKWEVSTFHRIAWKEVSGGSKRFGNLRETQYILRRDLHDWIAELVYRVDRELGEEIYFTMTLKAYPEMPIELNDSYHQPKIGSQSSPFSPLRDQAP